MKKNLLVLLVIALLPAYAFAVDCSETCADGEVMKSFADGNNSTCQCIPEGDGMVETVPNPDVEHPIEGAS